ncbi:MAG: hypothetical protein DRG78_17460 [Epsilonproteobacteria bacterium]|nr:MAG: hypothetical protein DRG78_17460 [Campylobacterota bacterium]
MVHHYKQIVSKILCLIVLSVVSVEAKEVPIMKTVTVNIPVKEYSILDFPFKVKDVQTKSFTYRAKVIHKVKKSELKNIKKQGISLSRKKMDPKKSTKKAIKSNDVLGFERGVNVLTFKPKYTGFAEMIIWGYDGFPIILKVNVVEPNKADKYIKFIELIENKKNIIQFESSSHEKIIEKITQHLYDESYKSKPSGYESIVRKDIYDVEVLNNKKEVVAIVRNTLIREIIGRDYLGQVWNVNLVGFKKEILLGMMEKKFVVDEKLELNLYEEMFDEDGIFSVSLETYKITKDHGTRVMVVRRRD